ncbi:YdcF family protein [Desulfobulbus sp. US2]|nr:YdcF family protein [Desulfobulbus sp. US4]MCW5207542.1 YdcF family protein [Desulfobulbus sp. US2]WLE97971.1 MAG: ElyC/SanA/YdcF family protein [Candidatus Electrothrix communis]
MIEFVRFLAPFLAPLPVGVFCILVTLFFLLFGLRKIATLSLLMTLGFFLAFGYGLPARQQIEQLERKYTLLDMEQIPEKEQRNIRFVVVLGSANITDPALPESNQLDTASLYRLVEGIRIQRQLPQTFLILSGGVNQDPRANAAVARRVAESLGVESGRLVTEERPRDTTEEAKMLQPMLKDMPFILVTSAAHMERAMKLFQEVGTHPIAAPTDFLIKNNNQLTSSSFVPTCENLGLSQRMIYEWASQAWNSVNRLLE